MPTPKRYYAINWTDGMKISREHFVQQENYIINLLSDTFATQLQPFNYGLLPAPLPNQYANDLSLEYKTTGELEIHLRRFDAITPGGLRITVGNDEVSSGLHFSTQVSTAGKNNVLDNTEEAYYVVLSLNPYEKLPVGQLNPMEAPPRHPYTMPSMELSMMPDDQFNPAYLGSYFVLIGRIVRKGGSLVKDDQFIPPCTSIRSHPQLMKFYENIGLYLNELQQSALSIVHKVKSKAQQPDLAKNIQRFCEETLAYIAQIYFSFRNVAHNLPPIYTIQDISSLANRLLNNIHMLTEKDKEEMLKYIFEWSDIQPSQLESQLAQAIELKYEHTRIGDHMKQADDVVRLLAHIFQRLNKLDYIGIHKENIVVKEEVITQTIKTKKGWNILD